MAGDWIKMTKDLAQKPEVRRLARILSLSRSEIVGRLHAIWSWADTHSFSGSGMDITEEDVDDIAELEGFAVALRQVGWLQGRASALEFPHFDRHNGQTAKRRAMEANKKANQRKYAANPSRNHQEPERDICPDHNGKTPGPEKRKEEKREFAKANSFPTNADEEEALAAIWQKAPKEARERSSKAQVADEWQRIKTTERPDKQQLISAIHAWNDSRKWQDGYAEGLHLWVKRRQWESIPEPAEEPKISPKTGHREEKKAREFPEEPMTLPPLGSGNLNSEKQKP